MMSTKSPSSPKKQRSKISPIIFTEEDELMILEAVHELIQEDCQIPSTAAVVLFNGGIQNKITAQVNKTQLGEKIRELRDKYSKETTDPELNLHQQKVSVLCKKIWGIKKNNPVKQTKMLKDDDMRHANEDDFVKNYPYLMEEVSKASNFFVSIDTLRYLDGSMLQDLNERWREQHFMESQHLLERLNFNVELVKLVLDAHTSSSKGKDDEEAMAVDDADDDLVGDAEDVDDDEEAEVEAESDDE